MFSCFDLQKYFQISGTPPAPSTKLWGAKHVFVKYFVAAGVSGCLSAVCKLLLALSIGCSSLSDCWPTVNISDCHLFFTE